MFRALGLASRVVSRPYALHRQSTRVPLEQSGAPRSSAGKSPQTRAVNAIAYSRPVEPNRDIRNRHGLDSKHTNPRGFRRTCHTNEEGPEQAHLLVARNAALSRNPAIAVFCTSRFSPENTHLTSTSTARRRGFGIERSCSRKPSP